jgi:ubiquinone/menaquinone biosynthesis C-methylase UbiE
MWKELAPYYDMMYLWKPYRNESARIVSLIRKYKKSPGRELLDVGCGTGQHIRYLRGHFHITGTDISGDMLALARKQFPGVRFVRQDMVSLDLRKEYDAIVCLFAAIAYTRTYPRLKKAITRFSRHLRPGGVLIIDPFVSPGEFRSGFFDGLYVDRPDVKLCRVIKTSLRGNVATLDCHFLLVTKDGIRYFHDPHKLGCFDEKKVLEIMHQAGLKSHYMRKGLMPGRGLYVGVKQLRSATAGQPD